jgi:hypothetical protein
MHQDRAVWRSQQSEEWQEGVHYIAWVDGGDFDTSKPGVNGEPGARWDYEVYSRQLWARCGPPPDIGDDDYDYDSPEYRTWSECADTYPPPSDLSWSKVVPSSFYPDYQNAALIMDGAVGGLCLLLTFPVVARRRPS